MKKVNSSKKANPPSIIYSKIDESYNADRGPDIFNGKEEFNDIKTENKGYLHDIPSENSSVQPLNKVSIKLLILLFIHIRKKSKMVEKKKF